MFFLRPSQALECPCFYAFRIGEHADLRYDRAPSLRSGCRNATSSQTRSSLRRDERVVGSAEHGACLVAGGDFTAHVRHDRVLSQEEDLCRTAAHAIVWSIAIHWLQVGKQESPEPKAPGVGSKNCLA